MNIDDIKSPLPPRRVSVPSDSSPLPPPTEAPFSVETPSPLITKTKKSTQPLLVGGIIFLLLVIIFVIIKFLVPSLGGKNNPSVTLNYWGLWENSSIMAGIISDFEAQNPGIKINYKMQDKTDYRSRLAGRLAKNPEVDEVPDIFRIHSSWLPMFSTSLAPVPAATLSKIDFDKDFYDVYKKDLKVGNSYYAIPLMYDGLSLFYNKDLLQKGGVDLPKSWFDLQTAASKLTVRDEQGRIQIAGVAMGTTDNVDQWSDIVALLIIQNGADILVDTPENDTKLKDVLAYYTNFRNKYKTWDDTQLNSTDLFIQGKLAFYFGPSWQVFKIEDQNPNLSFDITTVPQLPTLQNISDSSPNSTANLTNIHYATYWVEAVNSGSKHQKEAWKFLEFLASKDSLEKMYATAKQSGRSFGEIYPRISLGTGLAAESKLKPFINAAPFAKSDYLADNTNDSGLNSELKKYFSDAINNPALDNGDPSAVLTDLKNGLNQIIQKYHLK